MLAWIARTDYGAIHSDILSKRQSGTGHWFLESAEFTEWTTNQSKRTLFCPGIPGAGKTVMSSIVLNYLMEKYPHVHFADHRVGLAFIYFNYNMREQQNPTDFVAGLLKQLLQHLPSPPPKCVSELYDGHVKRGTRPQLHELQAALIDLLPTFGQIYVVADALDECDRNARNETLAILRKLQDEADNMKIMITARPHETISDEFDDILKLPIEADSGDVERFLNGRVHRLPAFVSKKPNLVREIKQTIIDTVKGM